MSVFPQTATYWSATPDGAGGFTFGSPTAVSCFWQDVAEVTVDATGNEIISNAKVYVKTDVALNGYLYLGTSTAVDPTTIAAYQIRRFDKIPNIRSSDFLRKVIL